MQQTLIQTDEQLKEVYYGHSRPMEINFPYSKLICHKILRLIPGRRLVVAGTWRNQPVVAKLFYSLLTKKRVLREVHWARWLEKQNIPVPKVLFYGQIKPLKVSFIIFEFIDTVLDINSIWNSDDQTVLRKLIFDMQEIIAKQHEVGCYHIDLHPNNFLVKKDKIVLTDLSAVRRGFFRKISQKACIKNLMTLYAQLPVKNHGLILEAFRQYCELRHWKYDRSLENKMLHYLNRARFQRVKETQTHYLKSGTRVVGQESFYRRMFCMRQDYTKAMQLFLDNPEAYITETNIFKRGNSCTLAKITIDNRVLVVKRYNIKGVWHWVRRNSRASRAIRSWYYAHVLTVFGIPTPRPVAVIENRFGPFSNVTYFINEYIEGTILKYVFDQKELSDELRYQIAKNVVNMIQLFAFARITHGDMKFTNFILQNNNPFIVDLDAMRFYRFYRNFKRRYRHDINRFIKNWRNFPMVKKIFISLLNKIRY